MSAILTTGLLEIGSKLISRLFPDKEQQAKAQLELLTLQQQGDLKELEVKMSAIVAEANSSDPWTSRARPSFMYVMYILLLLCIPVGVVSVFDPAAAAAFSTGMTTYLATIPEPLYVLFGTGYLGYTAARQWGKNKGVDK